MFQITKFRNVIDIKSLLKSSPTTMDELASYLYPRNNYPLLALKRVMKGKSELNETQIRKLAEILNLEIYEVFSKKGWVRESKDGVLTFSQNQVSADVFLKTFKVVVRKTVRGEDVLLKEYYISEPHIDVMAFIESLNNIIKIHE